MIRKIQMFVDDVLLFIRNPVSSTPVLIQCLSNYGGVSGFKINEVQSEAKTGSWPTQLDRVEIQMVKGRL